MKLLNTIVSLLCMLPMITTSDIRGISYFGLETDLRHFDCSWEHGPDFYVPKLSELGFNTIRVPFSAQYVQEGDFHVMDELFDLCENYHMNILLDYHRTFSSHQGDWFETNMNDFLVVWYRILERYESRPILKAVGIYNEYQGTDGMFWTGILREAIMSIETRFPNRFVFYAGGTNWGGNVHDIDLSDLTFHDRIRYEVHKYHFSTGSDLVHDLDWSFGSYPSQVVIGEWGWKSDEPYQVEWAYTFIDYLVSHNITNTFFWVAVVNSGDTGGIFQNCHDIDYGKVSMLRQLWGTKDGRHIRSLIR